MGKPTQALKGMNITHNTLQNPLRVELLLSNYLRFFTYFFIKKIAQPLLVINEIFRVAIA
jgi:hypothetical protein